MLSGSIRRTGLRIVGTAVLSKVIYIFPRQILAKVESGEPDHELTWLTVEVASASLMHGPSGGQSKKRAQYVSLAEGCPVRRGRIGILSNSIEYQRL